MTKFKFRRLTLCVIAFLLLLPTVILITRAIAVGNFPREGEAQLVHITDPNGKKSTLTPKDPLYGVVFDLLAMSDRVSKSSLPEKRDTYLLEFEEDGVTEQLKLYVATEKDAGGGEYLACYLRSSEKRFYRVCLPSAHIRARILTPSFLNWISRSEDEPLYTYSYSGNKDSYLLIELDGWEWLSALSLDKGVVSQHFRLYDGEGRLIAETDTASEIASQNPARVICTVRWSVHQDTSIEATYVFGAVDRQSGG